MNNESHKNILIIDNDENSVIEYKEYIETDPYFKNNTHVFSIDTIRGAVEILKEVNFDVIILDLNLLDSKGIDSLMSLDTITPVIVVSWHVDYETMRDCLLNGAYGYISKPVSQHNLNNRLKLAIENPWLRRACNYRILKHLYGLEKSRKTAIIDPKIWKQIKQYL